MTSALAVHHITAAMVSGQRNIKTVFAEMVAVVQKLSAGAIPVLCGYDSRKFDDKVHERCPTLIISIRHAVDVIARHLGVKLYRAFFFSQIIVTHHRTPSLCCTTPCQLHHFVTPHHTFISLQVLVVDLARWGSIVPSHWLSADLLPHMRGPFDIGAKCFPYAGLLTSPILPCRPSL